MSRKINSIIEIYQMQEVRIDNKPTKEKKSFITCCAEILNLYGNELYNALNIDMQNMLVFKIRYSKKLEELLKTKEWKVLYNNVEYDLYYTDFSKEPFKYVYLKCKGSN